MAKKQESREETLLKLEKDEFKTQLDKQIKKGRELLEMQVLVYPSQVYVRLEKDLPVDEKALGKLNDEYKLWNDLNEQILKSAFTNNGGEYLEKYKNSGFHLLYSTKNRVEQLKDFIREDINELQSLLNRIDFIPVVISVSQIVSMKKQIDNEKIFIVHGHDEVMKQSVARTIEKLNLDPIILHEQADGGKTIIEKFESNAEKVGFAVILLSADDLGASKKDIKRSEEQSNGLDHCLKARARQNVVFEMGYFIGKLGRSHVFLLLEEGVEKPGDLDGIVYTPFDGNDGWKIKLVKELKACGYKVSLDNLIK